jgi:hypothetical protein
MNPLMWGNQKKLKFINFLKTFYQKIRLQQSNKHDEYFNKIRS